MRIDDQERAAVRRVLERLGDEATPPPAFEQLRLSPTTARPHTKRVVIAVLVALVAVAGLGFAAQWVRTDPPIETATLDSEEASMATPSAQPTSEASQVMPSGFRPPRFEVDDQVVFPVTLLDGSRVALWLPDRFPFDPETYVQSAGLEATDAALPGIRVDVENCVECRQGHTIQVGPWQIVATGDELTDEVWDQYSDLIETFPTEDGYLRLGGEVTVTPVDSPDVVLQDEGLRVSVFARECASGPSRTQTARGFLASSLEAADATGLCATDERLEVWLPDSMSESELDAVMFELVEFGPLTRGRRGFDSAGPVRNSEVIVTSGGFREDRLVGYDGSTTQPIWQSTTGAGSAFILAATIDTVVAGGQKGPVQGIRFLDGSAVWQIEVEEGESPGIARINGTSDDLFLPSSFSREGATDAPKVRAIDVSTGTVRWTTSLSTGTDLVGARPTVTDSLVLVADTVSHPGSASATSVHALDRRSGEVTWLFDLETGGQGFHTQEIVTDNDSAYVTSGAGTVFAIDLDTGTERWQATRVSAFDEQLQLRDGLLVSGRYCLDITNGVRTGCPSPPGAPGVFDTQTDTVMIFDNGYDSVVAVDLDRRTASRLTVGGSAGDQPYRLWMTNETLIAGWGSINATELEDLNTRAVGDATIFVPSVEPGTIWLIDYPDGRIGGGTPTYALVTVAGETLISRKGPDPAIGLASIGFSNGLVLESNDGLVLWHSDGSTDPTSLPAGTPGFVSDTNSEQIAWCSDPCTNLRLTNAESLDETVVDAPGSSLIFGPRSARFSPDGETVAAILADETTSVPSHLALIDASTGEILQQQPIEIGASPAVFLTWQPDSTAVYYSAHSWNASQTSVGRYTVQGSLQTAVLPFGSLLSAIAVEPATISLEGIEPLSPEECRAAYFEPGSQIGACTVDF